MRYPSEDLSEDRLAVLRTLFIGQFERLAVQSGFLLSEADWETQAARRSIPTASSQTQEDTSPRG